MSESSEPVSQKGTIPSGPSRRITFDLDERELTAEDGFRYDITPKFFDLYLFLALKRRTEEGDRCKVHPAEILQLRRWVKNNLASVGKQIQRHTQEEFEDPARNIIELEAIKGPFKMAVDASLIEFRRKNRDVSDREVEAYLGLPPVIVPTSADERSLYELAEALARGDAAFRRGDLEEALAIYQSRDSYSTTFEQRVAVAVRLSSVFDRLGRYADAGKFLQELRSSVRVKREWDYLSTATVLANLAWCLYRQGCIDESEREAAQALWEVRGYGHYDVRSDAFRVLGKVREARGEFDPEAKRFYQTALDCAVLASDPERLSRAYYDLGRMLRVWTDRRVADYLHRGKDYKTYAGNYVDAKKHLERSKSLAEESGNKLGSVDADIELAAITARLGDLERASELIAEAEAKVAHLTGAPVFETAKDQRTRIEKYKTSGDLGPLLA